MKDKKLNFFERIVSSTPSKNKKIGIPATILAGISLTIAESGVVDNRPILKMGLELLSAKLTAIAIYQGQKVDEPKNEEND